MGGRLSIDCPFLSKSFPFGRAELDRPGPPRAGVATIKRTRSGFIPHGTSCQDSKPRQRTEPDLTHPERLPPVALQRLPPRALARFIAPPGRSWPAPTEPLRGTGTRCRPSEPRARMGRILPVAAGSGPPRLRPQRRMQARCPRDTPLERALAQANTVKGCRSASRPSEPPVGRAPGTALASRALEEPATAVRLCRPKPRASGRNAVPGGASFSLCFDPLRLC